MKLTFFGWDEMVMLQMSTHNLQLVQVLICPQLYSDRATIFQRSVDKKLNKGISVSSKQHFGSFNQRS